MRIKNLTLMLMAVLFSAVGFAQKPLPAKQDIAVNRLTKVLPSVRTQAVQTLAKQTNLSAAAAAPQNTPAPRAAAKAPAKAPEVVTPPESGETEYYTLSGTNNRGGALTRTVKVVWDDKNEDVVYISGLCYYLPNSFVMGTFSEEGDKVVFKAAQYMGDAGADIYFGAYGDGTVLSDAVAAYNEEDGSFTFDDYLLDNGDPQTLGFYAYWEPGVVIMPAEEVDVPVEIPKDLRPEKMVAVASDYFEDNADYTQYVNVGIYGKIGDGDVYIQGLSTDAPEAWVKGSFTDETTVVFPSGQMLEEDLYFVAIDENFEVTDEYILIYDPKTESFTEGAYAHVINTLKDEINHSVYQLCTDYEIKKISERAATPNASRISAVGFDPTGDALLFNLAKVDLDYEGLVDSLLSYKLYYMDSKGEENPVVFSKKDYPGLKDDMEEISSTFTDGSDFLDGSVYLNMDHSDWTKIGIQGVYYGDKERNESKISWYTPTWPQTIELPEGLTVTEHTFSGELYDSEGNEPFERTVGLAFDGDDMYIRGIGETDEEAWVKGTKNEEGVYVFPKGQSIGLYGSNYRLFFVGIDDSGATDIYVTEEGSKYVFEGAFLENARYTDRSYYLNRFVAGAEIYKAEAGQEVPELVEVPEGLETEKWLFKSVDYFDEVDVARPVQVGFYGDDEVYVQGLSQNLPDAWVKGTIEVEDDVTKVTFATGQYLGVHRNYDTWFIGYNMNKNKVVSYTMELDEENFTMSNLSEDALIGVNTYKAKVQGSLFEFYHSAEIKKIIERAATPVTPSVDHINFSVYGDIAEFSIPTMDTEGEGLVDSLISYKLYYDEGDGEAKEIVFTTDLYEKLTENMTEVPYGFIDDVDEEGNPQSYDFGANFVYLNMEEVESWARIGIQSIYHGKGESNASEIGWYTPTWPQLIELPEGAEVAAYTFTGSTVENSGDVPFTKAVNVAMVDDDLYIQGVGTENTETWIKGTRDPETNIYTFPKGQTLGILYNNQGRATDYLFLIGYNSTLGEMDAKIKYDEENGIFTTTTEFVENADYTDKLYYWNRINAGAEIAPIDMNRPAIPADPAIETVSITPYGDIVEFDIPAVDIDGIPVADSLLSYKLYYLDAEMQEHEVVFTTDLYENLEEDMTIIPYGFLDDVDEEGNPVGYDFYETAVYLNMDISEWQAVGIQSIYTGGEETHESEISWYNLTHPYVVSLPEDAETQSYGFIGTDIDNVEFSVGGVNVAKVDDDIYIQGIISANREAWIKGTKDAETGNYVFDPGQMLALMEGSYSYYFVFLMGFTDGVGVAPFEMEYDEETGIFTSTTYLIENADYLDQVNYYYVVKPGAQLVPGDGADAIANVEAQADNSNALYNVAGQRVSKNYKGIVVKNGKKVLRK